MEYVVKSCWSILSIPLLINGINYQLKTEFKIVIWLNSKLIISDGFLRLIKLVFSTFWVKSLITQWNRELNRPYTLKTNKQTKNCLLPNGFELPYPRKTSWKIAWDSKAYFVFSGTWIASHELLSAKELYLSWPSYLSGR